MPVKIYHNPRCSKSRQTLQLLRDNGVEPEIIEYLKTPPSAAELDGLLKKLKMDPHDLMRTKEAPYQDHNLAGGTYSREQLINFMVNNPVLIERPIVVNGRKAAIGRPPEAVLEIL